MVFGVGVQRRPLANKRQAIAEVESTEACARIIAPQLLANIGVIGVEEALKKSMNGNGFMTLAAPDHRPLKPEFKIVGRLEAEAFGVGIVGVWGSVAFETADQEFVTHGSQNLRDEGNIKRFDSIDAEVINVFGIVAIAHASADARTPPVIALAEGNFVPGEQDSGVCFLDAEVVGRGYRPERNRRVICGDAELIVHQQRLRLVEGIAVRGGVSIGTRLGIRARSGHTG